jgi:D-serine deaminase-like pyridoxal phosphate-dependent protein
MSRPTADPAVVDAGLKALAFDSSPPLVGDKIRLVPGHCDPTVNLYDWYVCIRPTASSNSGRLPFALS